MQSRILTKYLFNYVPIQRLLIKCILIHHCIINNQFISNCTTIQHRNSNTFLMTHVRENDMSVTSTFPKVAAATHHTSQFQYLYCHIFHLNEIINLLKVKLCMTHDDALSVAHRELLIDGFINVTLTSLLHYSHFLIRFQFADMRNIAGDTPATSKPRLIISPCK